MLLSLHTRRSNLAECCVLGRSLELKTNRYRLSSLFYLAWPFMLEPRLASIATVLAARQSSCLTTVNVVAFLFYSVVPKLYQVYDRQYQ